MSRSSSATVDLELQCALDAVLAGHHAPRDAGAERARRLESAVTSWLGALAAGVAAYDLHLLVG